MKWQLVEMKKYPEILYILGATSIEKITKISASGQNFLDPLSPSSKKGPTKETSVFVPNSNYKV